MEYQRQSPILSIEEGPLQNDLQPVTLNTERGAIACRFYPISETRNGAIWVGGAGGGWDTPARDLYPRICSDLLSEQIASLRLRFRFPHDLNEAVFDLLCALDYLSIRGIDRIALTGHSFGGSVVIQAAAHVASVRTVITLATQSYGAAPVALLAPRCSILLLHGQNDEVLPPSCSQYVHTLARAPKRLIIYPGANHCLDEVADQVYSEVRNWIVEQLVK